MDVVVIEAGEVVVRFSAEDMAILSKACDVALANGSDFTKRPSNPLESTGNHLRAMGAALKALSIGCIAQAYVLGKELSTEAEELEALGFEGPERWKLTR